MRRDHMERRGRHIVHVGVVGELSFTEVPLLRLTSLMQEKSDMNHAG